MQSLEFPQDEGLLRTRLLGYCREGVSYAKDPMKKGREVQKLSTVKDSDEHG